MKTRIDKPYVTTRHKNLVMTMRALVLGVFIGGIGALSFAIAQQPVPQADVIRQQRQMHKTCKLPDIDGAMTVFVMEEGKIKCWRWK